ncbi:Lrp/AsnC family transcriptional regulator [Candidatus Woesearchaeota archaeon]|nr:Lrp/AsnC family transcriptional regulator [Candidatus Woesearchaeota archaeon]
MNQKLDTFDRKILKILLSNSRESVTSISKKIGLGRENVDYRLKRLISTGFIKDFITEFNEKALRIKHHIFFAQLIRLMPNDEKDILEYLKQHKYISWIGTAAGKWTLIFDIYLTENIELHKIVNELLLKLSKHVEEYSLLELESGKYFFEKYLEEKSIFIIKKRKKLLSKSLDLIDYKILSLLNQNSRINYAELSEKIGLTANGIKKRINDLEKEDFIQKYSITLDFKRFGYEWYGIQLKLTKFDRETIIKIQQFFKNHPKMIFYYKYIGPWDYDLGFLAKKSTELRDFINELRTRFPAELKIVDVFITLEEIKGYQLPGGVFEKSN